MNDNGTFAQSIHERALLCQAEGDKAAAEHLYHQALDLYKKSYGNIYPDVAQIVYNLALLHLEHGEFETAAKWVKEALDLKKSVFGDKHTEVGKVLNRFADMYCIKGDFATAEVMMLEVLDIYKSLASEEDDDNSQHANIVQALNNLAVVYRAKEELWIGRTIASRGFTIESRLAWGEPSNRRSIIQQSWPCMFCKR